LGAATTIPNKEVLLLGATFATGNMGVGALASGALAVIWHSQPNAHVRFLDYGKEPEVSVVEMRGCTHTVPLVNLRYSWRVLLQNNVVFLLVLALLFKVGGGPLKRRIMARNKWLHAIASCDVAVAISGGDSFSDIYGLGRFFYVTLPQLLITIVGKPLVLLPQTIGPFRSFIARHVARYVMRRAVKVYSRDHSGVDSVRKLLGVHDGDPKARFCFDIGFVIEARKPVRMDLGGLDIEVRTAELLIGLNISGLLLMGGYGRDNTFDLAVDYRELVDRVVELLINELKATVLLVPHVFGCDQESDTSAVSLVYDELRVRYPERLFCVRGTYDQNEIKYIIGRCDVLIGSRMHACIAALSQEVPAVGIAYSDKFRGVLESVGVAGLVTDARCDEVSRVLDVIREAVSNRNDVRRKLRMEMPRVRSTVLDLLSENVSPR
jgi:polysaccharide pyruvyl transferase WcaK-like protein